MSRQIRRELLVAPCAFDGSNETSVKVLERIVRGDVADEASVAFRIRVKTVGEDQVVVTIERKEIDTGIDLLLRLPG